MTEDIYNNQLKRRVKKLNKKPSKSGVGLESLLCSRGVGFDENENMLSGCGPRMRRVDDGVNDKLAEVNSCSESRCDSPPNNTFTRMISDPEAIMQKTRQQVLSSKLSQFAGNGSSDLGKWRLHVTHFSPLGGTLKIYGELIDPSVPYKTLLLSTKDTVHQVIRQALDKYGLEFADPASYCLVMRTRYANELPGMEAHEEILHDDFCPLKLLLAPDSSPKGIVTTFEVRSLI